MGKARIILEAAMPDGRRMAVFDKGEGREDVVGFRMAYLDWRFRMRRLGLDNPEWADWVRDDLK